MDGGTSSRRSASPQARSNSGSASNVVKACEFCRTRKIRCDGKQPCANCERRGNDCEYATREVSSRPRPSRALLNSVEQELNDLESFVRRLKLSSADERDILLSNWSGKSTTRAASASVSSQDKQPTNHYASVSPSDASPLDANFAVRQMHIAVDGRSSFHGLTSIFDHPDTFGAGNAASTPHLPAYTTPEERKKAEIVLVDAAERGRRQEIFDLAAGRLDFDGVPAETAMELLDIHWHRQHHALLLTYRPAFMRDMAVAGGGKYFSKLLLNVIFFGASKFCRRPELRAQPNDPRSAGYQFLKRVNELMGESITRSRIPTIQALLLLASSLFALGQHESSWIYSGLAFRMLVDLGLHIDNTAFDKSLTCEDVEIRRRVLYGSFCFDKIHSLYQGRPPTLQEGDIRVPLVFNDAFEESELWRPPTLTPDSPAANPMPVCSVSAFSAMCKLCFILGRALTWLYSVDSFNFSTERHLENLRRLETDLRDFESTLPGHLQIEGETSAGRTVPANLLALHCVWNTIIILVHRPFVAQGHIRDAKGVVPENSWQRCIQGADTISELLKVHSAALGFLRSPFLISYCAYIAATVHVRVAAQLGPLSPAFRRLQFCLEIFNETETVNTGVSRAKLVILSLMQRLNVSPEQGSDAPAMSVGMPSQNATHGSISIPATSSEYDISAQQQFDMNALFASFAPAVDPRSFTNNIGHAPAIWLPEGWSANPDNVDAASGDDVLFGLMSGGNLSSYERLFISDDYGSTPTIDATSPNGKR